MIINIKSKTTTSGIKYTWTIASSEGRVISSNKMYSTEKDAMKAAQEHLNKLIDKK